jgi:tetratricopeptide (TPR) repeat protein
MAGPSVFLSYSHKDETWKDRLLARFAPLAKAGRLTLWDDRRISPGSEWFIEIERAMDAAAVAVCLVSENYLRSTFCTQYEVAPLLARRERGGLLFVPVLLSPCGWNSVHWLKPIQMTPRDGKTLQTDFAGREDAVFDELAELVTRFLDDPAHRLPTPDVPRLPPECVEITRLPYTGFELVGRDAELARLMLAWRSLDTNVITLFGWGGVGKTTLVNKWLERLEADGFARVRRVFAWSFAAQGDGIEEATAEPFIHTALEWFGDTSIHGSPWAKGERLAARISSEPSLLILDGIESLQSKRSSERGRILDPALSTLLVELAQRNPGLCVVTSREPVADLRPFPALVAQENLEKLSDQAGRALLRLTGVRGPDRLLEEASRSVGGHALALRLLSAHLRESPAQLREQITAVVQSEVPQEGSEADRLLAIVDERLGPGPARELLCGLSLFDTAVGPESLEPLWRAPAVEGLNAHSREAAGFQQTVRSLRKQALVIEEDERRPEHVESHPIVRAYFARRMQDTTPDAWREANHRLFEHHAAQADQDPQTLADAEPALKATFYGARAGDVDAALTLFHRRLTRQTHFWTNRLGAPGAVLSALSPFFQPGGWSPVSSLPQQAQAYLLNTAGTALRALGRFQDAADLYRAALASRKQEHNWQAASKNASNLAEVLLVIGHTELAHESARQSVELARQSGDPGQVIFCLTTLADVLHQMGDFPSAGTAFIEAEEIHRHQIAPRSPRLPPVLYRTPGLRLGEFLLSAGKPDVVLERHQVLTLGGSDIANEETAYGLALCAEAMHANHDGSDSGALVDALRTAERAVAMIREASSEIHLPRILLTRARIFRAIGDEEAARGDIDRALTVATRNAAALSAIDALSEKARLETSLGNRDRARLLVDDAKARIDRTGYRRFARSVEELQRELSG